ncbi:MAG: AAA family ATPase [Dehalococcoidia bacterium]|nr:AAA family ATPase [Dehalococcoidia bacterium]
MRVSEVASESLSWLWDGRIPLGKITILDGDPGLGKSTMLFDIAARVTTGRAMPDGNASDLNGPAGVLILSAEDGLADTIRPRLEQAGADLDRVVVLESVKDEAGYDRLPAIPDDIERLEAAIQEADAALVVLDPLMAYLGANINSYRDQDVRRALGALKGVAERSGAANVAVRHLNKAMSSNALYRGGGSIGIVGAARSALLVAADPDDPTGERRILVSTKSNLGPPPSALAYRLVSSGEVAVVSWEGLTAHTATDLLRPPTSEQDHTARGDAEQWLLDALCSGPVAAKDLQQQAGEAGIAQRTLQRAKRSLRVTSTREGNVGESGRWVWGLPADQRSTPRQPNNANHEGWPTSGDLGELPESDSPPVVRVCRYETHVRTWLTRDGRAICTDCHPPPPGHQP